MLYSYRIEQAIRAAAILHREQVRKGVAGLPYVSHAFAVAMLTADYKPEEDIFIAALLHDTIEDTDYTEAELRSDFGEVVGDLVATLSEPKTKDGRRLPWGERKKAYLKQLAAGSEDALLIAAADKIHNLRSLVEDYYNDEKRYRADFGDDLDSQRDFFSRMRAILNERLDNPIINEFNHVHDEYQAFTKQLENQA